MNIVFTPTAWEQYTEWQREDKKWLSGSMSLLRIFSTLNSANFFMISKTSYIFISATT